MANNSKEIAISVVIPSYNAANWLPKTVPVIERALINARVKKAEIIVVNDGSSDNTIEVANALKTKFPLRVATHKNSGRFLTRKRGALEAKYPYILFNDTRVLLSPNSLKYLLNKMKADKSREVWVGHIFIAKEGNVFARFWEAIAYVAWRKYFAKPKDTSYGLKDFDHYPKGTGCFFVPKDAIIEANKWFESNTKDLKTSNDDTLLIRRIAHKFSINVSPEYSAVYHARSNLKQFTKHVKHRGMVFVDGFLRRDGNRFFWPLLGFLIISGISPFFIFLLRDYLLFIVTGLLFLWLLELLLGILFKLELRDAFSLFILTPLFALFYGLGIWQATFKLIKRRLA